ncbi:unnamed protein product, partial [Ectocarpus sp. 13 AM-2016]
GQQLQGLVPIDPDQQRRRIMEEVRLSTVILVCASFGVLAFVSGSAENIWRKVKLAGIGAVHMLLSKDKKFKPEVCLSRIFERDTFGASLRVRETAVVCWYE